MNQETNIEQPNIIGSTQSMSPTIGKLAAALAKAQMKIEGAKRDAENPFFKSAYADLSSVWDACHTALNENEIAVVQSAEDGFDFVSVSTMLIHSSGEWIRSKLALNPKDKGPQAVGSAITYGRRYALSAMAGVCPIDDDGEAAQGRNPVKAEPSPASIASVKNSKKSRITLLMKQAGLQPTTETPEAWAQSVKSALDLDLIEANYDKIISVLEATNGQPA